MRTGGVTARRRRGEQGTRQALRHCARQLALCPCWHEAYNGLRSLSRWRRHVTRCCGNERPLRRSVDVAFVDLKSDVVRDASSVIHVVTLRDVTSFGHNASRIQRCVSTERYGRCDVTTRL